ncbi:MAG: hypothetical protein K2X87_01090, partial [Gemmataceae bacterium]|nr:hypothetical protein [Gemmataceae bacterium]
MTRNNHTLEIGAEDTPRPGRLLTAKRPSLPLGAGTAKSVPGRLPLPDPEVTQGDCFVVANTRGECWDGERWVKGWGRALQFRRPDPAYELCEQAAQEAEQLTGMSGMVCYIVPGTPQTFDLVPFIDFSQSLSKMGSAIACRDEQEALPDGPDR